MTGSDGWHGHRPVGEFANSDLLGARARCGFGKTERGAQQQIALRQIEEHGELAFDLPVVSLLLLAEAQAENRRAERVVILEARRLEPAVVLDAQAQATGEVYVADFALLRRL